MASLHSKGSLLLQKKDVVAARDGKGSNLRLTASYISCSGGDARARGVPPDELLHLNKWCSAVVSSL